MILQNIHAAEDILVLGEGDVWLAGDVMFGVFG
jgi:hypothetical protein